MKLIPWPLWLLNRIVTLFHPGPPKRMLAYAPLPLVFWSRARTWVILSNLVVLNVLSSVTILPQEEFLMILCLSISLSPGILYPMTKSWDLLLFEPYKLDCGAEFTCAAINSEMARAVIGKKTIVFIFDVCEGHFTCTLYRSDCCKLRFHINWLL